MHRIYIIMGPSSSGKDTIYKKIIEAFPELKPIVLYTCRPIREGEINGETYNFVTLEEIRAMEARGEILEKREYETTHGLWVYATSSANIDLESYNYITINTLEGYRSIYNYYKEAVVPVYIQTEDGIRLTRALEREKQQTEPKYAEMCRRFLADCKDFDLTKCDLPLDIYSNDSGNVEDCVNKIKAKMLRYEISD